MYNSNNFKVFGFLLIILILSISSCEESENIATITDILGTYDVISNNTTNPDEIPPGQIPDEYVMYVEEDPAGAEDRIIFRNIGDSNLELRTIIKDLDFTFFTGPHFSGSFASDGESVTFYYYSDDAGHNYATGTKR